MRTKHEFCHFSVRCFFSYYSHCLYDDVSPLSEIFYFALQLFFLRYLECSINQCHLIFNLGRLLSGEKIYESNSQTHKKLYLTLSILVNCSILVYFKYMNFFISSIDAIGFSLGATQLLLNPMHIILPLGVSFYTFEAISYIVDIYRGKSQLVAG